MGGSSARPQRVRYPKEAPSGGWAEKSGWLWRGCGGGEILAWPVGPSADLGGGAEGPPGYVREQPDAGRGPSPGRSGGLGEQSRERDDVCGLTARVMVQSARQRSMMLGLSVDVLGRRG